MQENIKNAKVAELISQLALCFKNPIPWFEKAF